MPRADSRAPIAAGIALLAALPFANAVRGGFTFDDVPIVAENPRIRSLSTRLVTTDWWDGARPESRLYRPLTMASFAVDYAIADGGAATATPLRLPDRAAVPFHVQNVLWHAAAAVALFLLIAAVFDGVLLAAVTAALFAVHPVHTEAVDGIVGRAELMAAFFALATLRLAWGILRDDPPGFGRPLAAGAALLAALLAKEHAITVPAVAMAWAWLLAPGEPRALLARRSVRRLLAALAVSAALYLAARAAVVGSPPPVEATPPGAVNVDNPVAGAHGAARLLTPVRAFGEAARLLVVPLRLSADYSFDQVPVVAAPDATTALCLLGLAGVAVSIVALRRRAPAVSCGLALFLITWLFTSNLFFTIGTILGERLLYLPSAGVCLAAAALIVALPGRRPAAIVAIALVAAGAGRTWARNRDWASNLTLFASATVTSPRSCKAAGGYASELYARGRAQEALVWAERALAIHPGYGEAHLAAAQIRRSLARDEKRPEAARALRERAREHARAARDAGDRELRARALGVLGSLELDDGRWDEAERALRAGLALKPQDAASAVGLGVVLATRARGEADPARRETLLAAALAELTRAIALDPGHAEAHLDAASVLRELGQHDRAEAHERQAIALSPRLGDARAAANLHGVRGQRLLGEKRLDEALAAFREAARLTPEAARARLGIGATLAAQADAAADPARREALYGEAVAAFDEAIRLEPSQPDAYLNLGIVLLRARRDAPRAANALETYLRLVPDAPARPQLEAAIAGLRGE
jgi:tetratricopeptide (TPR) repeat protein